MSAITWEDAEHPRFELDHALVHGYHVYVSLEDEGPLTPAYYWEIRTDVIDRGESLVDSGWSHSPDAAKADSISQIENYWMTEED